MTAAEKRVADLIAALRPFVAAYQRSSDPVNDPDLDDEQSRIIWTTLGDLRRADRVLGVNTSPIAAAPDLRATLDPETLEAIAAEIDGFEHSARAASLRVLAKQQRAAIAKAEGKSC